MNMNHKTALALDDIAANGFNFTQARRMLADAHEHNKGMMHSTMLRREYTARVDEGQVELVKLIVQHGVEYWATTNVNNEPRSCGYIVTTRGVSGDARVMELFHSYALQQQALALQRTRAPAPLSNGPFFQERY